MKSILFLLLVCTFGVVANDMNSDDPSCCLCKFASNHVETYLKKSTPDTLSTELFTRYVCLMLQTTSEECNSLIQGSTVLLQKLFYDTTPQQWCYNLEICPQQSWRLFS